MARSKLPIMLVVLVLAVLGLSLFSKRPTDKKPASVAPTPKVVQERAYTSLAAFASKPQVTSGETFSITIAMSTRENLVTGAQLELTYDPSVITVTSISSGNFFAKPVEYAKKIDSAKGEIIYAIGSFEGKKGSGAVAKLEAKARKKTNGLSEVLTIKSSSIITETDNKTSVLKDTKGAYLVIR